MLRILEPYDLASMGHLSAPYLHHLVEAKKLAYADLVRYVGDADHLVVPANRLLADGYIAGQRTRLNETRAQRRGDPGDPRGSGGTIYLTAGHNAGEMGAFIKSPYGQFLSGIVLAGT